MDQCIHKVPVGLNFLKKYNNKKKLPYIPSETLSVTTLDYKDLI